jgi:hypothetical protein
VGLGMGASCARSSSMHSFSAADLAAMNETQRQRDEDRRRCRRLRDEPPSPEQVRALSEALTSPWFDGGTPLSSPRLDRVVARLDAGVSVQVVAASAAETFSTVPNGVFVTSALLEAVVSDDALAGFVAHEVGHLEQGDLTLFAQREAVWRCEQELTARELASIARDSMSDPAVRDVAGSRPMETRSITDAVAASFRQVGFGESAPEALAREQSADERALLRLYAARIDPGAWDAALRSMVLGQHPASAARLESLGRARARLPPLPPEPPRKKRSKASK